jgi:hypothetical protein
MVAKEAASQAFGGLWGEAVSTTQTVGQLKLSFRQLVSSERTA